MFETVFVPRQRGRAASAIAVSAAGQSLLVGGLMMTSLIFSEALPVRRWAGVFAVPVPPPSAARSGRISSAPAATLGPRTLFLPPSDRAPAASPLDFADQAPSLGGGVPGGLPGVGVPGGLGPGGTVGPAVTPTAPPPPPRAADPPKETTQPITQLKVGGLVQAARIIHQVKPAYPPLARQARVQGTVKLEAVIDREGAIRNLRVLTGPPLLVKAAVDAVLQWRYRPTFLNDNPVEVLTQIDVNFTLTQ